MLHRGDTTSRDVKESPHSEPLPTKSETARKEREREKLRKVRERVEKEEREG